jgi:hypothetical protein
LLSLPPPKIEILGWYAIHPLKQIITVCWQVGRLAIIWLCELQLCISGRESGAELERVTLHEEALGWLQSISAQCPE